MRKKRKNTLLQLICIFLFLILIYKTKTIQNFYNIGLNNYEKRFSKVHDFCKVESVGYIKYLKKKYGLIKRPIIINYIHTPDLNWVIVNPKEINNYSNYKILLNYPGKLIYFKFDIKNNDTYQISKLNFYKNKTDKIKSLEIKFKDKVKLDKDLIVELYSDGIKKEKEYIKTYKQTTIRNDNVVIIELDLDLNSSKFKNETITFKIKNLDEKMIDEVKFVALNKYNLEEYDIIDNYKNCYLIK